MDGPATGLTAAEALAATSFPGIFWSTDTDLVFTAVTGGILTRVGFDRRLPVGRTIREWFGTDELAAPAIAIHERALRGESAHANVVALGLDLSTRVEPLRDARGEIVGVVGLAVEAVGDEAAAAFFERRIAQQEVAARLGLTAIETADLDELFRLAAEVVRKDVGAAVAAVVEPVAGENLMHVRAVAAEPDLDLPDSYPLTGSFAARVLADGTPMFVGSIREDATLSAGAYGLESGIAAPLRGRAGPVGVLSAFSHERHAFSAADASFVLTVANILSSAIERENAESLAAAAIETIPSALLIVGDDGVIVQANAAAELLTGIPRAKLVGRAAPSLSSDPEAARRRFASLAGGGPPSEGTVLRPGGEIRTVSIAGFAHFRPGLHLIVLSDVTAQRALERSLRDAQRMEAVGQLAAGIAHDFNNLLVAVRGLSSVVLDELPEGSELHADVAAINLAGERGIGIVNRLLAFARPPDPHDAVVVSPAARVESMRELLQQSLRPDIELELVVATGGNVLVQPADLEQAVVNLVVNARDAIAGPGRVEIRIDDVMVKGDEADAAGLVPDRYVRIQVTDDGAGMDAETARRATDPFFTTKDPGRGTGLGLTMAARLAESDGGTLTIETRPGQGSRLALYLPYVDAAAEIVEEGVEPVPGGTETVLVVDDDAIASRFAVRALERAGYTVVAASTGAEAIEAIERDGIAAAVLDLIMPVESGRDLARRLRAIRPELPVRFVSANATSADVLAKPYSEAELARLVRQAIDSSRDT